MIHVRFRPGRRAVLAAIGGAFALLAAAGGTMPALAQDDTLTIAIPDQPGGLEPTFNTGPYGSLQLPLFETLVRFDANMALKPMLASSWEYADGAWVFHLRDGITFHDGTPFNADAVVYTVERILDPATKATRRTNFSIIKTVEAVDERTVSIVTDPATPDLPFLMADRSAMIVSPKAMTEGGAEAFNRAPVGTGPYKFDSWLSGQSMKFVPYEGYWGSKATKSMVFRFIRDPSARAAALQTGEADVALNLAPNDAAALGNVEGITVNSVPATSIVEAEMRISKPPFDDVRVRKAINMAIDTKSIVDNIMRGAAIAPKGPGIASLDYFRAIEPFPYDPDGAKALLAEAGYPNGFEATFMYVPGRFPNDDPMVQAIQAYLGRIGVTLKIQKLTEPDLPVIISQDPDTLPGVMVLATRTGLYQSYNLARLYSSKATSSSGLKSEKIDGLIAASLAEFDPEKRAAVLGDLQQAIWDEAPFLYLFTPTNAYGFRDGSLEGFEFLPTNDLMPLNSSVD